MPSVRVRGAHCKGCGRRARRLTERLEKPGARRARRAIGSPEACWKLPAPRSNARCVSKSRPLAALAGGPWVSPECTSTAIARAAVSRSSSRSRPGPSSAKSSTRRASKRRSRTQRNARPSKRPKKASWSPAIAWALQRAEAAARTFRTWSLAPIKASSARSVRPRRPRSRPPAGSARSCPRRCSSTPRVGLPSRALAPSGSRSEHVLKHALGSGPDRPAVTAPAIDAPKRRRWEWYVIIAMIVVIVAGVRECGRRAARSSDAERENAVEPGQ